MKLRIFMGETSAVSLAVIVHAVFVTVLLLSFDWSPEAASRKVSPERKIEPIQATVVDETRVQAELAEIEKNKQAERKAEEARAQAIEHKVRTVRKRQEEEERKLADIQRQLREQQARQRREQEKAERLRKEKEKAEKERQRKAEEAARKKEEAARKKKEAERKRREAEKARQKKLAAERAEQARQREQLLNRYRIEYVTDIKSAVERNWIRPPGMAKGLECKLKVIQTSNGDVLDVSVTTGSGNVAFDRSAVAAVFKASPLPKPRDPEVFDRTVVLTLLNPEN